MALSIMDWPITIITHLSINQTDTPHILEKNNYEGNTLL